MVRMAYRITPCPGNSCPFSRMVGLTWRNGKASSCQRKLRRNSRWPKEADAN